MKFNESQTLKAGEMFEIDKMSQKTKNSPIAAKFSGWVKNCADLDAGSVGGCGLDLTCGRYLKLEEQLLDFLVPQYINEGKAQLVISVGCTGGQHRSVFIANKLYEYLREKGYNVDVTHRDVPRKK